MEWQRRQGKARPGTARRGVAGQRRRGAARLVAARRGYAGKAWRGATRRGRARHYTTQTGERVRGINCAHFLVTGQQQTKGDKT